jgi:hypothetical protein
MGQNSYIRSWSEAKIAVIDGLPQSRLFKSLNFARQVAVSGEHELCAHT